MTNPMNKRLMVDADKPMPGVYVGDPCYILPNDFYQKFWGEEHNWEDGALCTKDGRPVMIVCGTMYGDGCYQGTVRNNELNESVSHEFPVDAGVLAIVNLEFADPKELADMRENPDDALGVIIDTPCIGICLDSNENGEFRFNVLKKAEPGEREDTHFVYIETGDYPEDEDDYEDDWEEENNWEQNEEPEFPEDW